MKRCKTSLLYYYIFLIFFSTCSMNSVEGGKDSGSGHNTHDSHLPCPAPAPLPNQYGSFSVLSFGAKGDGVSDDSKALIVAWKAACKVNGASVEIPAGFKFLIKPITLKALIDGTLMAPPKVSSWSKSRAPELSMARAPTGGLVLVPLPSSIYYLQNKSNKHIPVWKPTALRFYSSY
ncbi:hypothetical protein M0R45_021764 [Rubus argutus]|uniref:Polygalacturonase n=1 Tax=Rubus argutus TaxID=59490 RepID=A0AAW1XDL6_RUBAR